MARNYEPSCRDGKSRFLECSSYAGFCFPQKCGGKIRQRGIAPRVEQILVFANYMAKTKIGKVILHYSPPVENLPNETNPFNPLPPNPYNPLYLTP